MMVPVCSEYAMLSQCHTADVIVKLRWQECVFRYYEADGIVPIKDCQQDYIHVVTKTITVGFTYSDRFTETGFWHLIRLFCVKPLKRRSNH